jgi:hypothetical protein
MVPSIYEGLSAILLFSLFVLMTPMILCAGAPLAVFVAANIYIFEEDDNNDECNLHYYIIAFPWIVLAVCITLVFQIYAMVLAIFAAPVLVIFIAWDIYKTALRDIR